MLTPEQVLLRKVMSYGAWRDRAHDSKKMKDRKKFVAAETALLAVALEIYDTTKRKAANVRHS